MRWIAMTVVVLVTLGCAGKQCPSCGQPPPISTALVLKQSHDATDQLASTIVAVDQASKIEVDNLSNAETTAYKSIDARVGDNGSLILRRNFDQGPLENTGRSLDIAIQGNGFFRVRVSANQRDGFTYTRNGALNTNNCGDLVVAMGEGYRIDPPITLPPNATNVCVGTDGVISYISPGSTTAVKAGQLQLFQFVNPQGLTVLMGGLFQATNDSNAPIQCNPGEDGTGQILQGFLEGSNVDKIKSQVRMQYLINWRNDLMEIAKKMSPSILVPNISQK